MTLLTAALVAAAVGCNPYHDALPRPACRDARDCELGEGCRNGRCARSGVAIVDVHLALDVAPGLPLTLTVWDASPGREREPLATIVRIPEAYPYPLTIPDLPSRRVRVNGAIDEPAGEGDCGSRVVGAVETLARPNAEGEELWLARRAPRPCRRR